jgi:hypothetical protein
MIYPNRISFTIGAILLLLLALLSATHPAMGAEPRQKV